MLFKGEYNLQNLGGTRSSQQPSHLLLTADTFVRAPLPGMKGCTAVVHAGPALGAAFTQYTAEFESGGELGSALAQRFIFVLEGSLKAEAEGKQIEMGARQYAYFPERLPHRIVATKASRVAVIEKPYQAARLGGGAASDHLERRCCRLNAARRRSGPASKVPASGLDDFRFRR